MTSANVSGLFPSNHQHGTAPQTIGVRPEGKLTVTKEGFLAEYRDLILATYSWASDPVQLESFMAEARATIYTDKVTRRLRGSFCAKQAWRNIGGKGQLTYKALRALPEGVAPVLYRVENVLTGLVFGEFKAIDEAAALDAMARAYGYRDFSHAVNTARSAYGDAIAKPVDS